MRNLHVQVPIGDGSEGLACERVMERKERERERERELKTVAVVE